MTFRLAGPRFYAYDDNGDPLAGGTVSFYEAGTSTPKDTYSDSAKTATNANPVVLDDAGSAPIFLDGDYKVVCKDADGITIFTQDNVSTPPTTAEVTAAVNAAQVIPIFTTLATAATQTVGADIKRCYVSGYADQTDAASGAHYKRVDSQPTHALRFRSVDRYISDGTISSANGGWWEIDVDRLDARQAGYLPDGLTASASVNVAALTVCKNYLAAKGGGTLLIPPGTAHCNAAWPIGTTGSIRIIAEGVILDFAQATATVGVSIGAASDVTIEGDLTIQNADSHGLHVTAAASVLRIAGVHFKSNGGDGAKFDGGSRVLMERCKASLNTGDGFAFDGGTEHDTVTMVDCSAESNGADGHSIVNARAVTLVNAHAATNTGRGAYAANCGSFLATNPVMQGNTGSGIEIEATDALNAAHDVANFRGRIVGLYASGNGDAMMLDATATGTATINLRLDGAQDTGATDSVTASGDGVTLRGDDNTFSGAAPDDLAYVPGRIYEGVPVATTSGTEVDRTGFPTGIKSMAIQLNGVSFSGSDALRLLLGDSGGLVTSGYTGQIQEPGVTGVLYSTSFQLSASTGAAATLQGTVFLNRADADTDVWTMSFNMVRTDTTLAMFGAGRVTLAGPLDRYRLTSLLGSVTFDAGTINEQFTR